MASIRPATPTQTSPNHFNIKLPPTNSPNRSPRRSPRKSSYTRNSPSKRPSLSSKMCQKSATTPNSDSKARTSNQAESSKPRTKEGHSGFATDASVYLRHYETAEDEEQDAEEEGGDDFNWVKYTKECRERREAKEAQSSEQKKS